MDIVKVFARNLKKYRKQKGLSQNPLRKYQDCIEHISVL